MSSSQGSEVSVNKLNRNDYPILLDKMKHPQLVRMPERCFNRNRPSAEKLKALFYDPIKHRYLARTCREWARVLALYTVFFTLLIGMTYGLLKLFLEVFLDKQLPFTFGPTALIGEFPGVALIAPKFRNKLSDSYLIEYSTQNPDSWFKYVASYRKIMEDYRMAKINRDDILNCSNLVDFKKKRMDDLHKICHVPATYEPKYNNSPCFCQYNCDQNQFGYDEEKPCFALSVSKLVGWTPGFITASTWMDRHYKESQSRVKIECKGDSSEDDEQFDHIKIQPRDGIPHWYYPYYNAPRYRQPFVTVQVIGAKKGRHIHLKCIANANNATTLVDEKLQLGMLNIDVLIT